MSFRPFADASVGIPPALEPLPKRLKSHVSRPLGAVSLAVRRRRDAPVLSRRSPARGAGPAALRRPAAAARHALGRARRRQVGASAAVRRRTATRGAAGGQRVLAGLVAARIAVADRRGVVAG